MLIIKSRVQTRIQMNSSYLDMQYFSLSDLEKEYNVSKSTIRRMYWKIRDSETKVYIGNPIVKTELLTNGKEKIFLLKEYLDKKILKRPIQRPIQEPGQSLIQTPGQSIQLNNEVVEILRKQLDEKDKQINEFQKSFNNFQELEEKIIVLVTDLKDELVQKNRMLEEKNGEIQRLQSISVYRQTLLERFTEKEKNYQDKEVQKEKYTKVEVVDDVQEVNDEVEKSFLSWIEGK